MAQVIQFSRTGGPEVLEWAEREIAPPGPGAVTFRTSAVGLNFIDTYHRSGLYAVPLPSGLGLESSGVVTAVGEGVTGFAPGDRVASFGPELGAYATERTVAATGLFKLPDTISDEVAAAALLKGCTAEFLIERAAQVQPGWTVLVHAAAGGVGQLLVQWLSHIGATVIATVGTEEKAARAKAAGAAHILFSRQDDIAARVREITGGTGVQAVFDGVGAATWEASLAATARRGLILSYGNASGPVQGVNLATLNQHGSLFVTRPKLGDYYVTPEERAAGSQRVFDLIAANVLRPEIGQRFALREAAEAHRQLEAGKTEGSTILLP
ncbi:quinone oxidoreductase family protein [Sphingomonas sp. CJ20]